MIELIVFLVLSVGIIVWFRKSLLRRQTYGFFRLFAFESLLGLLLISIKSWFTDPLSITQIVSWILLLGSIIMAVQGFYLIHTVGKPKHGIEETTVLVKRGVYKYIRHPLYSSLMLLGWGIFFKEISLLSATLVIMATAFLVATAKVEETENLNKFGDEYSDYMKTTKRFLPFLV